MKDRSPSLPGTPPVETIASGNKLLWVLLTTAIGFAIWHPRAPQIEKSALH